MQLCTQPLVPATAVPYCCLQLSHSAVAGSSDTLPKTGSNGEELIMPGMEFMMECYEDELKRPIRNLVSGQLARSLLIQVP